MKKTKYKKRNFYLLLFTLLSTIEASASSLAEALDMSSYVLPKVKIPKIVHQIEEWRAIFSEHKEQALTVNDHCENLKLKLDQVYSHVGSKMESDSDKRDVLAKFYEQDIEIYNIKQLNFHYFNAINLRLSFLLNPYLFSSRFAENLFSKNDLRIDDQWKDIEQCKSYLLELFFSNQSSNDFMIAFIYNSTGSLHYKHFVEALTSAEPIGLVSLPINVTNGPHANLVQYPALFLLHDLVHWKTYSRTRYYHLRDYPKHSILEIYAEIYKKSHALSVHQHNIIEGSLFNILHETATLYTGENAKVTTELSLSTTPEKPNSEELISTEFKLHQSTIQAYQDTIEDIFQDHKEEIESEVFSNFLRNLTIIDHGNKFKALNIANSFEFFLGWQDNTSAVEYLNLPIKFKYSIVKTETTTESQPDFWLLTKAEIKEYGFTEHMVRHGVTFNGATYTCNQLEDISKNMVDKINESPEDVRTIQARDEDFEYDLDLRDTVRLLEWAYDETFPKNSKGQVSLEIINLNVKRMYQDFYEISKSLLFDNKP